MANANQSLIEKQITTLNEYLKTTNASPSSVKVLDNIGDYSHILKFPQLNDFNVTLTLQVHGIKFLF
jgi:hypothetical protein